MDPIQSAHVKLLAADLLTLTVIPRPPGRPSVHRGGRLVTRAESLGVVVSRDRKDKFLRFALDDGTGCVPCILWLNHHLLPGPSSDHHRDLTAQMALERAEAVRLGALVRVRGRITVYRDSVQITVGDVAVERDPNAEVLHWLDCIRLARHCYDAPPPPPPASRTRS